MKRTLMHAASERPARPVAVLLVFLTLAAAFARIVRGLLLRLESNRRRRAQSVLSNHILKDIGLSRAELNLGMRRPRPHD
jgi:uncharacterized protein YjiS (DUF1127 family)